MESMSAAQAVEALMHAYGKLVFHMIYGFTGDWEESQDLTQDTFLQALRAIDAARASSSWDFHAKALFLRIAVNTVHLMRFIPFSRLSEEGQEERETSDESLSKQAASMQPACYGVVATVGYLARPSWKCCSTRLLAMPTMCYLAGVKRPIGCAMWRRRMK